MTTAYLGSLSLGVAVPGASAAAAAGIAGINGALPDLQAQLTALLAFVPTPVDFTASLTLALSTVTAIQTSLALGITPPDISAQLAIIAAQVAAVTAQIGAINAQLSILVDITSELSAAGVHGYVFDGAAGDFGGDMGAELVAGVPGGAGPGQFTQAVVLITTSPAAWASVGAILKVTP